MDSALELGDLEKTLGEIGESEDRKLGDGLSYIIGDTFIDYWKMSPLEQWTRIARELRTNGFHIVKDELTLEKIYKMEDLGQILSPRMKELKELLKEEEVKEAQELAGKG